MCVHSCHESDLRSVQDNPLSSLLRVFSFISISDILDRRRAFGRRTDAPEGQGGPAHVLGCHIMRRRSNQVNVETVNGAANSGQN